MQTLFYSAFAEILYRKFRYYFFYSISIFNITFLDLNQSNSS